MNRALAIIKAAASGVTALYHAVEAADFSTKGEDKQAHEAAAAFQDARIDFMNATDSLRGKKSESRDIPIARTAGF